MKREQLLDIIGDAPDVYVADAKTKPRVSKRKWWLGGIAAVLAVVLCFHLPAIPMIVSASCVSRAPASRMLYRSDFSEEELDNGGWELIENQHAERTAQLNAALPSLSAFTEACSYQLLSESQGQNRVWSPVNAYIALAMTAELSGGDTRAQLLDVLGTDSVEVLRARISAVWEQVTEKSTSSSMLANSLWLDDDAEFVQETMDALAYHYYASVYQGDLGSDKTNRAMTNWMRNQTGGLLSDRTGKVSVAPDDQVMTIASTVYFYSKWKDEFSASDNTQGVFHTDTEDLQVTYMNQKEVYMYYYWAEDFGAVEMGLKNGARMWFFLPDDDKTVGEVLSSEDYMEMIVNSGYHEQIYEDRKWMKVNFSLPKFDITAAADLKEALSAMGLSDLFEPTGNDFSPSVIRANENHDPVYLADIHQDTRIQVDEQGVAAAAYIELNFGAGAAAPPEEIIDFVLDRPFVFAITQSSIPLFVGVVNCP